jgi:hypothetical protein
MENDVFVMRTPCERCEETTGYIVHAGPHLKVLCSKCHSYQYFAPQKRKDKPGYETIAILHKVTKNDRTFYAGKSSSPCPDCGVISKKSLFLFKEDDGTIILVREK